LIRSGKPEANWIGFDLAGAESNRDAIGTRIKIEANGFSQFKYVNPGGSYLASNDKRVLFGLGTHSKVNKITIDWPSGKTSAYSDLNSNRYYRVIEGGEISELFY